MTHTVHALSAPAHHRAKAVGVGADGAGQTAHSKCGFYWFPPLCIVSVEIHTCISLIRLAVWEETFL